MITVVIPVGPSPADRRWLPEALASVCIQTEPADEVLLIDDMAGLVDEDLAPLWPTFTFHVRHEEPGGIYYANAVVDGGYASVVRAWRSPWHLGVAAAFNAGVALARNDLVLMLGADDTLEPGCIEACLAAWETNQRRDDYYWLPVRYMDGEEQALPCNAAMVTKGLWRRTGGFPVETASGAPDAALISILLTHEPRALIRVSDRPLYNVRRHAGQDTAKRGSWQGVILSTRDILTDQWKPPAWGR